MQPENPNKEISSQPDFKPSPVLYNEETDENNLEDKPLLPNLLYKTPKESRKRWVVLFLTIMSCFSCYYCYENPQPLQPIIEDTFQIQDAKFNMLYSMANLPNIIAPFIGGIIIDTFGVRVTMTLFSLLVITGQIVITVGAKAYSFDLMVVGRFVFGLGYQIIENCVIVMITKWFLTKEFTLGWGLARTILRISTALNSFLTPYFYHWSEELYFPFLFGVLVTIISFSCAITAAIIDKRAEEDTVVASPAVFTERILLQNLKVFSKLYYLVLILTVLTVGSFYGLTNNINNILGKRFGFPQTTAGSLISIIYLVAAALSPFVGCTADRVGRRVIFMLVGVTLLFAGQFHIMILEDRPPNEPNYTIVFTFFVIGTAYSFFSTTLWTSFSLLVEFKAVGTALGLVSCSLSLFQAFYTETLGFIHDNSLEVHMGYFWTQVVQCIVLGIAILLAIVIYFLDIKKGGRLYKTKEERAEKYDL